MRGSTVFLKAFDTVPLNTLLNKLNRYGIHKTKFTRESLIFLPFVNKQSVL